jgi:uncharacterized protein YukE
MNALLGAPSLETVLDRLAGQVETLAATGQGSAEEAYVLLQQALDQRMISFDATALLWAEAAKLREELFSRRH